MYLKWMLLYYKQRFDYVRRVITMMNLKQTSINVAKRQQSVGIFIIDVSVRITHKIRGGKKRDVCVTKVTIIPPPTPAMLHVSCPNQPISIDPCASLCAVNAVWMRGWWGGEQMDAIAPRVAGMSRWNGQRTGCDRSDTSGRRTAPPAGASIFFWTPASRWWQEPPSGNSLSGCVSLCVSDAAIRMNLKRAMEW